MILLCPWLKRLHNWVVLGFERVSLLICLFSHEMQPETDVRALLSNVRALINLLTCMAGLVVLGSHGESDPGCELYRSVL